MTQNKLVVQKIGIFSLKLFVGALLLFAGAVCAIGQQDTRATLGGNVKDPSGAIVRNATVIVTADDTNVAQTTKTDSAGDWTVKFLVPGNYHFEVSAPGFKTTENPSIELQVADQKSIDTQLQVGAATETVTVQSVAPLIDTSAADSGTVVTDAELEQVPTQSNAPTMFLGLTPGAVVSGGVGGGVFLWSNGGLSGSNVDGTAGNAINYSLDGAVDSTNAGTLAFEPPLDAVAEFKVVTNAYDAAIARQSAATINLDLKSGKDAFHGDLYEDNQNNFLNARYYNAKNNPVHLNQFGGSVGGPVWIPKLYNGRKKDTFFFFTYAGIHNEQPVNTGTMSIPSALEKTGDFSQSFTTNGGVTFPIQIFDPLTYNAATGQRTQFPNNVIPSNRLNPIAVALLNLIPSPDTAHDAAGSDSNNYTKKEAQVDRFSSYTLRVDQTWNSKNRSYVSLRQNLFNELSYDPYGPSLPYVLLQGLYQRRQNRGITLDHTLTLTSNLVADLRYSVTRYEGSSYDPGAGDNPTTLGFPSSFAALQQLPSVPAFTGIVTGSENGGQGTTQADSYTNDTNQDITAGLTQTYKKHNFRYGYEYLIQQEGTGGLGASGGTFAFGTNWTTLNPDATAGTGVGSSIASMLLGLPNNGSSLPTNATAFWSQHYTGVYFQDDWRLNTKLTLDLGLRWDVERPVTERSNKLFARYDPNYVNPTVTASSQPQYAAEIAGASTNTGIQLLQSYRPNVSSFVTTGAIEYAGVNGTSRSVVNTRLKYIQPRLGFAYQFTPKIVLRGGLGRFVQATFYTGSQTGFSVSTPITATNDNYHTIAATLSNPLPTGLVPVTGNSLGVNTNVGSTTSFTDPNAGRPYTDQASIYLQNQIKNVLVEIGGTLNITHGEGVADPLNGNNNGYNINLPSQAAWLAANTPTFNSAGLPSTTLAGSTQVTNPFKGAQYITNGEQTASTVSAYQLLRPNPVVGDILFNRPNGKQDYYALNTKVEKRFQHGFSLLQSFTWSKRISENNFIGPQAYAQVIERRLDSGDQKFHYVLTPVYELPFGRGKRFGGTSSKWLDAIIGGYEVSGIYNFLSGTPLVMPTNTSFFEGGDPAIGAKTRTHWFDTSHFAQFPTSSTTVAQLAAYPTWTGVTGLPGAGYTPPTSSSTPKNGVYQDFATHVSYNQTTFGDLRNPYTTDFTLGIRKAFAITEKVKLQLRMDAFNALNHPRFGNIDTTPGDTFFGYLSGTTTLSQVNAPRQIQLAGRLFF